MTHRIDRFALAFIAVTAIGAAGALGAQAASFDIGASPAVLTGHSDPKEGGGFQEHRFTLQPTKIKATWFQCPTASFEAKTQGQMLLNDLTLTPTYGPGCEMREKEQGIGGMASIQMNGCKYTVRGEGQPANTGLVDIVSCTAGKQILLQSLFCTYEIPAQNGIGHVVSKAIGSGEITMQWTLTGITMTQSGSFCATGDPKGHHSSAVSFAGSTVVKAFKSNGTQTVLKHNHMYEENIAGEQVSLAST